MQSELDEKALEAAARLGWEHGRNSWCPAGILTDTDRTERDWLQARTELAPALDALPAGEKADGWRPIKSAPRDGTAFLAWGKGYALPEILRWFAYDADVATEVGEPGYFHFADALLQDVADPPTDLAFWMPLPPSPARKE